MVLQLKRVYLALFQEGGINWPLSLYCDKAARYYFDFFHFLSPWVGKNKNGFLVAGNRGNTLKHSATTSVVVSSPIPQTKK